MANYYEKARTNYFKVSDETKFSEFLALFSGNIEDAKREDGQHCLLFDEESGVPSFRYDEKDEEVEVDFMEELSKHLTDDSIVVLEAVGSEKFRYLCGYAVAYNNKGESVAVNLDKIYDLAKEKFGVQEISKAMY